MVEDESITENESLFSALGLGDTLVATLAGLGYEEPTPIQKAAIPDLLAGRDLVGQAETGTGKTAAFALPLLQRIADNPGEVVPRALVLVPTRELAMQVSEAVYRYGRDLGIRVAPIYGGQPIGRQLDALRRGVHVVVATPGRAVDHINRGSLVLSTVEVVVLDEADEMLDMGFAEDLDAILQATPKERQTVLFSATLAPRVASMARRHLRDPVRVEVGTKKASERAPLVTQRAFVVSRAHKPAALGRILDAEAPAAAIVFCRTRGEVDQLTETLNGRGYRAEALHGGLSQEQRDRVMGRLRAGTAELLIATDVAARGLDIDQLTHVVNYDVPAAAESYVHRIGRVGRAGREGVAITLAEPRERRLLANIESLTGQRVPIEKLPTVADVRARQRLQLQAAVVVQLADEDLERFGPILDALLETHELRTLALAALKLAREATVSAEVDEQEIPDLGTRADRGDRGDRGSFDRPRRPGATSNGSPGVGKFAARKTSGSPMVRIRVAAGRSSGVRPGDLVGAIANEAKLAGRDIGTIQVAEHYSLVEVPAASADQVIDALGRTTIKGRKASARRYVE